MKQYFLKQLNRKKQQKMTVKSIGKVVTVPACLPNSRAIFERNLKWREGPSPSFIWVLLCMCSWTFYKDIGYISNIKEKEQIWLKISAGKEKKWLDFWFNWIQKCIFIFFQKIWSFPPTQFQTSITDQRLTTQIHKQWQCKNFFSDFLSKCLISLIRMLPSCSLYLLTMYLIGDNLPMLLKNKRN